MVTHCAIKDKTIQDGNPGRRAQKSRTRHDLLIAAVGLLKDGSRPTVEDVAAAAGISRRTAYRYFRSQDHLLADAALEQLRPEMARVAETAGGTGGGGERLLALIAALHAANRAYEPQLRAILAASLIDGAGETGPVRGRRRVDWIEQAAAPLQSELAPAAYSRLVSALTVVAGYDAYNILREMRLLGHDEAGGVVLWMVEVLVRATLEDRGRSA